MCVRMFIYRSMSISISAWINVDVIRVVFNARVEEKWYLDIKRIIVISVPVVSAIWINSAKNCKSGCLTFKLKQTHICSSILLYQFLEHFVEPTEMCVCVYVFPLFPSFFHCCCCSIYCRYFSSIAVFTFMHHCDVKKASSFKCIPFDDIIQFISYNLNIELEHSLQNI